MDLQWTTTFYSNMAGTVAVLYFSFSKAFITVSRNSLIDKLMVYGLDVWTVRWIYVAELLGSKHYDQWHEVQPETGLRGCTPGVSPGVKYCWISSLMTWMMGQCFGAPSANLQTEVKIKGSSA